MQNKIYSYSLEYSREKDDLSYVLSGVNYICRNNVFSYSVSEIEYWMSSRERSTLYIPNTYNGLPVTRIGNRAFEDCLFKNIVIPEGVTSIGKEAFYWCIGLRSIDLPNSLISIEEEAFYGCDNLEYNIYDNAKYLGNKENPYLILVKAISTDITSCEINHSTKIIMPHAFENCTSLRKILIPNSVISIGNGTFRNCGNLTSITIPFIGMRMGGFFFSIIFDKVPSSLKEVILTGTTIISSHAFADCYDLNSVVIPESVTTIDNKAFSKCKSLKNIEIPNSVISIGEEVFYGCDNLEYNIYDNAKYLGNKENPYLILMKAISIDITCCKINSNTRFMFEYAFRNCANLAEIEIPSSVTKIGKSAFECCESLTIVKFEERSQLKNIGYGVFKGCENLIEIEIPSSVIKIEESAFECCESLTIVKFEERSQLKSIGDEVFKGCENLVEIEIPSSVTKIGESAFERCDSLENIKIPSSVTSIYSYAFECCENLTSVKFEERSQLKSIGYGVFGGCENLTSMTIPSIINARVIKECEYPINITILEGVTHIADSAFSGCHCMENIILSSTVRSIGEYAFSGCFNLMSITIPATVTNIAENAFEECDSLTAIYYGGTKADWYSMDINLINLNFPLLTIYYYSEIEPIEEGNYWYYDSEGNINIW